MKKWKMVAAVICIIAFLGACAAVTVEGQVDRLAVQDSYGAKAALADDDYTLEEMLTYALEDEYLARYRYAKVIEQGAVPPFVNIVRAEQQHIAELLPLFEAYDIPVPPDNAAEYVSIPETLLEVGEISAEAEIDNIAMYDRFVAEDIPDDVRAVFAEVQKASKNHLEAFRRLIQREQQ